ncbi:MAG: TerY-C metal binding domain-containing protein [Nostoc sp. DcaGUA01]|nr:TerY-C metal binding domain-containing protein [Nostoc sp. DcaGUA01]
MSNYSRRLPIYLLLDCSESMAGEAFTALQNGVNAMINELRTNPMALETVAISLITFASTAKQVIPLTDLLKFQVPQLRLGSGTKLGAALDIWQKCLEREVAKTTAEQKGDYKPICFILTDGEPTDAWENVAQKVRTTIVGKKANVIAVACGPDADTEKLRRITETVIVLKQATPDTFAKFFKWISASVSVASERIETATEQGVALPRLPEDCMEIPQPGKPAEVITSERQIFLHAKCVKNSGFYLLRYVKSGNRDQLLGLGNSQDIYKAIATHAVKEFEFEENGQGLQVSTTQLEDFQPCPYCSNQLWAMCSQGHVHCCPEYQGSLTLTCPWCNTTDTYAAQNFDVGRGRG